MNDDKLNIFLDKQWQNEHLKSIEKEAGPRYCPKLNIELPIAKIFDGISKTQKFYIEIREYSGNLQREFSYLFTKNSNKEERNLYNALKNNIDDLVSLLKTIKEYNNQEINWKEINDVTKKSHENLYKLTDYWSKESKTRQLESDEKYTVNTIISFCHKIQKQLKNIDEFSSSIKSQLSNNPFLLLFGSAGIGKTHLLCDIAKHRFDKSLPTVLFLGSCFDSDKPPLEQMINKLNLAINRKQFLQEMNSAGKKSNCRTVLAIDAINETTQREFWKKHLKITIEEIKKYPNIALVISIRKGFEHEVMEKNDLNEFITEEHLGFNFMEWEAINLFFKEYNLPLPEIPLLMPEFQNPLFLQLFCKAFNNQIEKNKKKNKNKQIFRGHEGATYIFESFIDSVATKISEKFKISNNKPNDIWNKIIKKIAALMVEIKDNKIPEEQVSQLVKKEYPTIDCDAFLIELERNLLIEKISRYSLNKHKNDSFDFKFPFQKFSEHLIGRYYFKKFEDEFGKNNKDLKNAKKFFSKRRKLGKSLSDPWNLGLVESLSIQCPEFIKGYELIEVAPYLKNSYVAQKAYIESLIWRHPQAFPQNTIRIVDVIHSVVCTEDLQHKLLNALISVAQVPDHPLNAKFLHECLSNSYMAKRDSWWTIFLHKQYGKQCSVDRLIEWALFGKDIKNNKDDSIFLCSVALCWFLTSSNRELRDRATKGLVSILVNRLSVVLKLLEKFKKVNDLYVLERLYAVTYGCVMRSKENFSDFENLSNWIFTEIFEKHIPPLHVLLRDYARCVIEIISIKFPVLKIRQSIFPPFNTEWINEYPDNDEIKLYKNSNLENRYYSPINLIIDSMQPEYSEINKNRYGNFGRYTFQSAISHFNFKKDYTYRI